MLIAEINRSIGHDHKCNDRASGTDWIRYFLAISVVYFILNDRRDRSSTIHWIKNILCVNSANVYWLINSVTGIKPIFTIT